MRILFAQNAQGIGGSENYLLRLLPALKERGHEVALAAVHNRRRHGSKDEVDRWLAGFQDQAIAVHYRETNHYLDPRIPFWLRRVFRRGAADGGSFDILHTHLIYADFWAAIIRALLDRSIPVVSTVHGYEERIIERYALTPEKVPHNLYWWVFGTTRRFLSQTYACSEGLKQFCLQAGIPGAGDWSVVEHGFDFPTEPQPVDPTCRLADVQVAVVGRLIHRKGVHMALEAMALLRETIPSAQLVVVGGGPELKRLEDQAESLGLSGAAHFIGFDPAPQRWMRASDVLVVPSLAEGLPLVIFEAMHQRCPVVAFATIGCRDMIADGKTGLLANCYDVKNLAAQIGWILTDRKLVDSFVVNASRELKARFQESLMVDSTQSVYQRTLLFSND